MTGLSVGESVGANVGYRAGDSLTFDGGFKQAMPTSITGCYDWWDASDEATLTLESGGRVVNWANKGSSGLAATAATGVTTRPYFTSGTGYIDFRAAEFMQSGAVSSRNFMHDGTGCTIFTVIKVDTSANVGILATRTSGTTQQGHSHGLNTTNRIQFVTGSTTANVFSDNSQNNAIDATNIWILSERYSGSDAAGDRRGYADGRNFTGAATVASAWGSGNSNQVLCIGALGNTTSGRFDGRIYEIIIYNKSLSDGEHGQVMNYLRRKYAKLVTANLIGIYGQSNATGQGLISASGYTVSQVIANSYIYDRNGFTGTAQVFYPLTVGVNQNFASNVATEMGFELKLAEDVQAVYDNCHYIKWTKGGTALATDWAQDGSGGEWNAFQTRVQEGLARLRIAGIFVNLLGVIWWQGETESQVEADANAYEALQREIIQSTRDLFGNQDLPYYMVKIKVDAAGYDFQSTVNAAKDTIAGDTANCYVIENTQPLNVDNIHTSATGQNNIGALIAQEIVG